MQENSGTRILVFGAEKVNGIICPSVGTVAAMQRR